MTPIEARARSADRSTDRSALAAAAVAALAALGLVAACGSGGAAPLPDAALDARIIVDCHCTTCDPLALAGQQGCNPGQKCTWLVVQDTPEPIGKVACVPDGTVEPAGACISGPPGELTGFDDCRAGNVCVDGACQDICGFGGGATEACATLHSLRSPVVEWR